MNKWYGTVLLMLIMSSAEAFQSYPIQSIRQDSVIVETIDFKDMNDTYVIRQYILEGEVVQMDIDRLESATDIDYIIWDMDKNGRMEAIGVYNVLDQQYEYHLFEEEIAAEALLEFSVQIEDIGFPGFYNSSGVPKVLYKEDGSKPELNYFQ